MVSVHPRVAAGVLGGQRWAFHGHLLETDVGLESGLTRIEPLR